MTWLKSDKPIFLVTVSGTYTPKSNGTVFNSLRFMFSDGAKNYTSATIGSNMGSKTLQWSISNGEYVTQVESLSQGNVLASLIFRTNTGKRSPSDWNNAKARLSMQTFPENYRIIGYQTHISSSTVQWFRFILAKITFSTGYQGRGQVIRSRSIFVES